MEIQFKFDNGESLTVKPLDTVLNQQLLPLWIQCQHNGVYQFTLSVDVGRDSEQPLARPAALEKIQQGFELTGIECPVDLSQPLTIQDCNQLHRIFTNGFMSGNYSVADLQLINHGTHEYESTLTTPNYMRQEYGVRDRVIGLNMYSNMANNTIDILDEHKYDLPDSADVYLWDDCRIGRSFADAWCQNDDPTEWDIRDIDRAGPVLLFQNILRKNLYASDHFQNWLSVHNYDPFKPYKDIPFGNIVQGSLHSVENASATEIIIESI